MTLRRLFGFSRIGLLAGALLLGAGLSVAVPMATSDLAGAQTTGYPPPAGATLVTNGATVTCAIGQTCTYTMGGFPPGASVTITVNGTPAATVTADANGFVTFTVSVSDPHISVNGGPLIAVPFGSNAFTLSGGGVTQSFTLVIPGSTTPTTAATSAASGTSSRALAFTGADIAATVVGGLAMLAVGVLLVFATRRRSRTANSSRVD